mgnify:CR=1 FL=1
MPLRVPLHAIPCSAVEATSFLEELTLQHLRLSQQFSELPNIFTHRGFFNETLHNFENSQYFGEIWLGSPAQV